MHTQTTYIYLRNILVLVVLAEINVEELKKRSSIGNDSLIVCES